MVLSCRLIAIPLAWRVSEMNGIAIDWLSGYGATRSRHDSVPGPGPREVVFPASAQRVPSKMYPPRGLG